MIGAPAGVTLVPRFSDTEHRLALDLSIHIQTTVRYRVYTITNLSWRWPPALVL